MGKEKREKFSSRLGVIAAAAGAAVGLGSIWKFPYEVGENGGATFILLFIICLFLVGIPVMVTVFIIGRNTGKNSVGALKQHAPASLWYSNGIMGVFGAFLLLAFYSVVAGWVIGYIYKSINGHFTNETLVQLNQNFNAFIQNPYNPIIFQFIFIGLTALIITLGVAKGIEKTSFILMPILLLLIILMDIYSITLDGNTEGFQFLFSPRWEHFNFSTLLSALGQAFFSLSIGFGAMLIYGSYIKKKENLPLVASETAFTTLIICILAGIAIFPALFKYNIDPSTGPSLLFVSIPYVFSEITGGAILSLIFFVLLGLAALTSSISILEIIVAYFVEEHKWKRQKITIIISFICFIISVFFAWSFGILSDIKILGQNIFSFVDHLISDLLLPVGGLVYLLFAAYKIPKRIIKNEFLEGFPKGRLLFSIYYTLLRYVSPIAIIIILIKNIIDWI
ncbi:MAG: sodium-dependent transporter [Hyphomicrobiales bacterium]